MNDPLRYGSICSGIGGLDLGFDRVGMECAWQVEINKNCLRVLEKHWPHVLKYKDLRDVTKKELLAVDVICGGDPCPKHSRARSNGASRHPDLAGYFLALVGRLRPRWVVRENVPAPTIDHFDAALAYLGYGTVVVRMDAAEVTGQSRQRDFIIGCYQASRQFVLGCIPDFTYGPGTYTTRLGTRQVTPALTTHRTRYDSRDCYIFDDRLRILDAEERERLAGFPEGWTDGFSEAERAKFYGNAVVPQLAEEIGRWIVGAMQ